MWTALGTARLALPVYTVAASWDLLPAPGQMMKISNPAVQVKENRLKINAQHVCGCQEKMQTCKNTWIHLNLGGHMTSNSFPLEVAQARHKPQLLSPADPVRRHRDTFDTSQFCSSSPSDGGELQPTRWHCVK